ncbi:beta-ketoacyl synthase N-terminal-like domain-containing protein, partial [Streptomyces sp. MUM 136J]|uniref:beta-ketoacyl synthase N-terminal-like domain-containing protein n=1 Tax=Streptomyces sp. MUM 136J TaxID=2791992 RepID=UPI0027E4867F
MPIAPYTVSAAEVVPGDLLALSPDDATARRWYVVLHTVPESPETIRLTFRPALGGSDRERVLSRGQRVTVGSRRIDPRSVPPLRSDELTAVGLRDGDRLCVLRVVDPAAEEVTYVRRWGVWHRDLDGVGDCVASDDEVRAWAASAEEEGNVVRHPPRPDGPRAPVPRPRRVVVTGLGAVTPLGVGELWQGLVEGRHGIRELDGPEFEELPVRVAGTVPVDPVSLLDRAATRRMNRAAQFAVLAAREAWGGCRVRRGRHGVRRRSHGRREAAAPTVAGNRVPRPRPRAWGRGGAAVAGV